MQASEPSDRVSIGPTWQQDPATGAWVLPQRTLGWQAIDWAAEYLRQPDGPEAGEPWAYTHEQMRFLLWWLAVNERGGWLNRSGHLRRAKGWGKDPFGATLCALEFVGPCRFGGFDAQGDPVGVENPAAWVITAAVAKDQTRNTMTLFPSMLSDDLIAEHSIDLGKEIIYAHKGRRRIEAVTSSPRALEGPRITFALQNEVQHWLRGNDGHEMAKVINRNLTKSRDGSARALSIANAPQPGEDSVAEHDYEAQRAIVEGRSRATGILYDSLEAAPHLDITNPDHIRRGLRAARGDSIWLGEDRHTDEFLDPRNSPASSRRFYWNQRTAAEDAWIAPHQWDALALPGIVIADGEDITLGFDGSTSDDHSALIGCRVDDGFTWAVGTWDPEDYGGEIPRDVVDTLVRTTAARYRVLGFFSDLHPWESYVDNWARDLPDLVAKAKPQHKVSFDMRQRVKDFTTECELVNDEIVTKKFHHDGDQAVATHVHNARRRPNAWGIGVGKESRESKNKIDSVPAIVLARAARRAVLTGGKRPNRRYSGRVTIA